MARPLGDGAGEGCSLVATAGQKSHVGPLPADTAATFRILSELAGKPVAKPGKAVASSKGLREPTAAQWAAWNPPNRVAIVDGKQRFLASKPRDLKRHPYGAAPGTKPLSQYGINLIPRSEWPARLAALKAANAGLVALCYGKVPGNDQASTNYCWANCTVQAGTTVAYVMGDRPDLLSAASVAAPITGYRNEGGWPADALRFMQTQGAVRTSLWPNTAINSRYAGRAEVVADYPRHLVTATIADLGSTGTIFDEAATCVLFGAPVAVSFDWWSHAVVMVGIDLQDGKVYGVYRNSWGDDWTGGDLGYFLLPEGSGSQRGTPDDAQAVLMMKAGLTSAIREAADTTVEVHGEIVVERSRGDGPVRGSCPTCPSPGRGLFGRR